MAKTPTEHMADGTSSDHNLENGVEMKSWSDLGGTSYDENEMRMLGRTQQLNVRGTPAPFSIEGAPLT